MTAKLWGLGAALAFAAQIVLLAGHGPGALVIATTLSWAIWQAWSYRSWLGTHLDMVVLMCAYGGLGMLAGPPQCHDTTHSSLGMAAGMLALGLPPVFFGSRCFAAARRRGDAAAVLLFDTLGMAAGMRVMHVETSLISLSPLLKHFVMVFGMAAGMVAGSAISAAYSKYSAERLRTLNMSVTIIPCRRKSAAHEAASIGSIAAIVVASAPVFFALLLVSYLWSR